MKINFLDFWGGFDRQNNFFMHSFKYLGHDCEIAPIDQCDMVIYSCCGSSHRAVNRNKTKKVFYTGENIRPNYNECDYSISFDKDSDQNIRIPLFLLYIDFFNITSYGNPFWLLPVECIENNPFKEREKTKRCAAVFSNPTEERMRLVKDIGGVDCYGLPFGNHSEGEDIKYQILSSYKFSLCPENTRYPGYVTEKLFHAKTAGTIPIYSGSNDAYGDFNPKCYLDIDKYSTADLVHKINFMTDEEYAEIFNEPIFTEEIYTSGGIRSRLHRLSRLFC